MQRVQGWAVGCMFLSCLSLSCAGSLSLDPHKVFPPGNPSSPPPSSATLSGCRYSPVAVMTTTQNRAMDATNSGMINYAVDDAAADIVAAELIRRGCRVVERQALNAVVREQGFRRMVNEDTAVRIGKLAGAQAIVIANVYNTSSQHHQGFQGGSGNFLVDTVGKMVDPSGMVQTVEMGVKMIDVQTAEVVWSDTKTERSRPGATTSHTEVLRQLVASLAFPADPSAPSGEISAGTGASGEGPCRHSPYVPEAREFQRTLRRLGYKIGQADGCLGEKTHTALRQFQRDQGLEITGELDDATKEALRGPVVKAPRETERAEPPPDDSEGSEQEIY